MKEQFSQKRNPFRGFIKPTINQVHSSKTSATIVLEWSFKVNVVHKQWKCIATSSASCIETTACLIHHALLESVSGVQCFLTLDDTQRSINMHKKMAEVKTVNLLTITFSLSALYITASDSGRRHGPSKG